MPALPSRGVTRRAAAAGPRTSWRGWLLNVLIAAAALLAGVGLGEWLVRWVAPPQLVLKRPGVWQPADSVGWGNRPQPSTTINNGEPNRRLFSHPEGLPLRPPGRGG